MKTRYSQAIDELNGKKSLFGGNNKWSLISGCALVILGVIMTVKGLMLKSAGDPLVPDQFNIYWMATFAAFLIGGINIFVRDGLTKSTYIARILVGALFVVSGLIKANDPMGFAIKLDEYFEPGALNWPYFRTGGWPMALSIIISGAEVLLGLAVLVGGLIRATTWSLLGMILFFAWLTYFTANCNDTVAYEGDYSGFVASGNDKLVTGDFSGAKDKYVQAQGVFDTEEIQAKLNALKEIEKNNYPVGSNADGIFYIGSSDTTFLTNKSFEQKQCVLDCGCFGDALKASLGRSLTPWESFFKDLVLLILIIPVFITQKRIKFNSNKDDVVFISGALLFSLLMGVVLFSWWFPTIFMLVFFALYLSVKRIVPKAGQQELFAGIIAVLMSFGFVLYTYKYLPIKDFRPYHIGANILEKMNDGEEGVYENVFVYKNKATGELKEFSQEEFQNNWETISADYDYYDSQTKEIKPTVPNSITDFGPYKLYKDLNDAEKSHPWIDSMMRVADPYYGTEKIVIEDKAYGYRDTLSPEEFDPTYYPDSLYNNLGMINMPFKGGEGAQINFTRYLLELDGVVWIVAYELAHFPDSLEQSWGQEPELVQVEKWKEMKPLLDELKQNNVPAYIITSATDDVISWFREETGIDTDILLNDGTELKIVVRSNPGVVYLEKGVVKGKWDYNRIPIFTDLK